MQGRLPCELPVPPRNLQHCHSDSRNSTRGLILKQMLQNTTCWRIDKQTTRLRSGHLCALFLPAETHGLYDQIKNYILTSRLIPAMWLSHCSRLGRPFTISELSLGPMLLLCLGHRRMNAAS